MRFHFNDYKCTLFCVSQAALVVKNPPVNAADVKGHRFDSWIWKILWRRTWQPTPIFSPGESTDRGAWRPTVHGVAKSRTQLKQLSSQHAQTSFY